MSPYLLAALVALSGERQAPGRCQPTFVWASEKPRVAEIPGTGVHWTIHILLIGCRNDLEALTDAEKTKAAEVVESVFKREDLRLLGSSRKKQFRDELARKINDALGREAVSDVAFLDANRTG